MACAACAACAALTFNLHSERLTFNLHSEQFIYPVQPQAVTQQHCRAMPTCASLRPTRIPQTHRGDLLTQAAGKRSSKPVALQNAPSIISSSSLALEDLPARSTSVKLARCHHHQLFKAYHHQQKKSFVQIHKC